MEAKDVSFYTIRILISMVGAWSVVTLCEHAVFIPLGFSNTEIHIVSFLLAIVTTYGILVYTTKDKQ